MVSMTINIFCDIANAVFSHLLQKPLPIKFRKWIPQILNTRKPTFIAFSLDILLTVAGIRSSFFLDAIASLHLIMSVHHKDC